MISLKNKKIQNKASCLLHNLETVKDKKAVPGLRNTDQDPKKNISYD